MKYPCSHSLIMKIHKIIIIIKLRGFRNQIQWKIKLSFSPFPKNKKERKENQLRRKDNKL